MHFTRLFALLVALAGIALAADSCRQCSGFILIIFKERYNLDNINYFLGGTLAKCATGGQYDVIGYSTSDCVTNQGHSLCAIWRIELKTWRYCGNGGLVYLSKTDRCVGSVCAQDERLSLSCNRSCWCRGRCNINECRD